MITIGLASSLNTEPPVLPGLQDEAPPSNDRKKQLPLVWIPVTLCLGLLLAAGYVGSRILTARAMTPAATVHSPPSPAARAETPVPSPPPASAQEKQVRAEPPKPAVAGRSEANASVAEPLPEPKNTGDVDDWPIWVSPVRGEKYIQVGAINSQAVPKFLARLRSEKLEPHLAPGPSSNILRVLLGPFPDHDSIARAKEQLHAAQIDSFVRTY